MEGHVTRELSQRGDIRPESAQGALRRGKSAPNTCSLPAFIGRAGQSLQPGASPGSRAARRALSRGALADELKSTAVGYLRRGTAIACRFFDEGKRPLDVVSIELRRHAAV